MVNLMVRFSLRRIPFGILLALAFASAACTQTLPASTPTAAPPAAEATPALPTAETHAGSQTPGATAAGTPLSTVTPAPTGTPTPTFAPSLPAVSYPLPTFTPTAAPPHLTILAHSACQYGPGADYLLKYGLFAGNWMRVVGRNPDGTWLNVKAQDDPLWNACWIRTDQARFDTGSIKDVPIVSMIYPLPDLYQPPTVVSASRAENVVTIAWKPVYMTEDDVRGYLVDAWVCQGGRQVFVPVGRVVSFTQNNNSEMMSLQVTDEPGCDVPSNARLYTVDKHGYNGYREIPWPGFEAASTASETPVPAGIPPASSSGLPLVSLQQYTDCLYGPGEYFLYKTSLPSGAFMEVIGRSPDGSWIAVEELNGWDPCWIPTARARFTSGNPGDIPVTFPTLPVSYWYKPPNPVAHRNGTEVKVSWQAVGMAEYDYRGYLIIAWVCQGGSRVYLPINIMPPYAENTGTLSVTIQDEPGCSEASRVHIYTAEKRGYFGTLVIWPQN